MNQDVRCDTVAGLVLTRGSRPGGERARKDSSIRSSPFSKPGHHFYFENLFMAILANKGTIQRE